MSPCERPYEVADLARIALFSVLRQPVDGKDAGLEPRHLPYSASAAFAYYATDLSFVIQFTQSDKSFSQSHNPLEPGAAVQRIPGHHLSGPSQVPTFPSANVCVNLSYQIVGNFAKTA
jgi:hypothetical protein